MLVMMTCLDFSARLLTVSPCPPACLPAQRSVHPRITVSSHPDHLPSKLRLRLRMMTTPLPLSPSPGVPALADYQVSGSPSRPQQPHGFPMDTSSALNSFLFHRNGKSAMCVSK